MLQPPLLVPLLSRAGVAPLPVRSAFWQQTVSKPVVTSTFRVVLLKLVGGESFASQPDRVRTLKVAL